MRTLNLGILAHVDAGKTTLTERLLFAAGAIDALGTVDAGTTQTDYLALERERGITIRSAVASFDIGDVRVNLIDTPGHPDFIAEVERVLSVLDAAILVISAVEGIQPQTPLLWRALRRLEIPTLLFINKIDRAGADTARVLDQLALRLGARPVALGGVINEATREATFVPGEDLVWRSATVTALADNDDRLLRIVVEDQVAPDELVRASLADQTARRLVQPTIFGAAIIGCGVEALIEAIATLLPASRATPAAPLSARVFKIERTPDRARSALTRVFAGRMAVRERVTYAHGREGTITHLDVFASGHLRPTQEAEAGQIVSVFGLADIRVGDYVGEPRVDAPSEVFAPPTLEATVEAIDRAESTRLRAALGELAEQDPLINVRQGDDSEIYVSLYGEVQREVIAATLERDYGVRAAFGATSVLRIERLSRSSEAEQLISAPTHTNISGRSSPDSTNPYRATLALRLQPARAGNGITVKFDLDVRLVPIYIYRTVAQFETALTDYVRDALREGVYGWPVTDCTVTVWDCGYARTGSTARDFRLVTELVVKSALQHAGTVVCEPTTRLILEVPAAAAPAVAGLIVQSRGRISGQLTNDDITRLAAVLPAAELSEIQRRLPGLTSGQGVLESEFAGYETVVGPPPARHSRDAG